MLVLEVPEFVGLTLHGLGVCRWFNGQLYVGKLAVCEAPVRVTALHEISFPRSLLVSLPMGLDCEDGLLQVIATCHHAGVVHGDVKPANFMLRKPLASQGSCALAQMALDGPWLRAIDFGCSQALKPDQPLSKRCEPATQSFFCVGSGFLEFMPCPRRLLNACQ